MLPNLKQRLIIALAIVIGAVGWFLVRDWLIPADGSGGISLFDARVGLIPAILLIIAAGIPALIVGLGASATGHPLSGIFAVATALGIVAASAGGGMGWMDRAVLPGGFYDLIIEMVIWQAGVVVMVLIIQYLRSPLHARWPALAFSDHLGVDTQVNFPTMQSVFAGLTTAAVAGVLGYFLLQSVEATQLFWGLMLAFAVGGLVGHLAFPNSNPIGVLFAPAIVAIVAYGYVLWRFDTPEQVMAAWFNRTLSAGERLPGLSLALPIFYISAGLAGSVLGMGWAQSIAAGERNDEAHQDKPRASGLSQKHAS